MQYSRGDGGVAPKYDEGEDMVRQLQANQTGVDAKLQQAQIQLFKNQQLIHSGDALDPTTAEGEAEEDDSDAEGSVSEDSESGSEAAESGSDEDEDEEDAREPGVNSTARESAEVQPMRY